MPVGLLIFVERCMYIMTFSDGAGDLLPAATGLGKAQNSPSLTVTYEFNTPAKTFLSAAGAATGPVMS